MSNPYEDKLKYEEDLRKLFDNKSERNFKRINEVIRSLNIQFHVLYQLTLNGG